MKELTEVHKGRLAAMSYKDYLTAIQEDVKRTSYDKGSSDAYWYFRSIMNDFKKRFLKEYNLTEENYTNIEVGASIHSTSVRLEDYTKYNKADAIATFKADIDDDITRLLYDLNHPK